MPKIALTLKAFARVRNNGPYIAKLLAFMLSSSQYFSPVYADVDDADSLDFESFHETDSNVKTWKSQPQAKQAPPEIDTLQQNHDSARNFEVREPFSNNSQSMSAAISNSYLQMGRYCPNGWKKLGEWSEKDGEINYLYFSFKCR